MRCWAVVLRFLQEAQAMAPPQAEGDVYRHRHRDSDGSLRE